MKWSGSSQRPLPALLWILLSAKVALLFLLALNTRFVMDEFGQFGWSKYIPGEIACLAAHHPKAVGYAYFYELAHLIGWNARSMLLAGRMETVLLACATLAVVYASARRLRETRLRSVAILLVLLSFSNFIERIFETRAEPLATFLAVAALFVGIGARGQLHGWRVLAAGAISGLAFLSTQKALYFDVALGIALVGDAVVAGRYHQAAERGAFLVLGWALPVALYCVAFAPAHPLSVARNLFFGPMAIASPQTAAEYGGLRSYLTQTLLRNLLLYLFCFSGMALAFMRFRRIESEQRIALIFSIVITVFVFAHNQPWPYVFVMALPFMALWALWPLDALAAEGRFLAAGIAVLAISVGASYVRNVQRLSIDNHRQLELVDRAESLLGPRDIYFDGIGMLPNRREPSILWLDRHAILLTLRERSRSELHRIFTAVPPKLIIWSYRMDAVEPVIGPLIESSYVRLSSNLRIAGCLVPLGQECRFNVPVAGMYELYDSKGAPLPCFSVNGRQVHSAVYLTRTSVSAAAPCASGRAYLLPQGNYAGAISLVPDDAKLFERVYD